MDLQLPEGEVAELPAHMQQALPHPARGLYAPTAIALPSSADMDIAVRTSDESLRAGGDLRGVHRRREAGTSSSRGREASSCGTRDEATDQQRDDNNECCHGEQYPGSRLTPLLASCR